MSEFRKDPIVDRWVIISPARMERPLQIKPHDLTDDGMCPFCNDQEHLTPLEIQSYSDHPDHQPNTPGWNVRIVPNKFPALYRDGELKRRAEGFYDWINGVGVHDVIVETPDHHAELGDLPVKHVESVFRAYYDRAQVLSHDKRLRYAMIFKNKGAAAGASLRHPHSQLIAMPIVPVRVMEEIDGAKRHYDQKERCIFCDILHYELKDQNRVVVENTHFVAIEPYAPRFPYETWVLPKNHLSHFEHEKTNHRISDLASIIKETLMRINTVLNYPPYNYMIHTSPFNNGELEYYHWHLEIIPRITGAAGFEWGTGFHINPIPPEQAAQTLRDVHIDYGNGIC